MDHTQDRFDATADKNKLFRELGEVITQANRQAIDSATNGIDKDDIVRVAIVVARALPSRSIGRGQGLRP